MNQSFLTSPIIPLILLCCVFYIFLIRPQQKKARSHRVMLDNLHRGDQVITNGGIVGVIVRADKDQEVEIEVAKGIIIRFTKISIIQVLDKRMTIKETKDISSLKSIERGKEK